MRLEAGQVPCDACGSPHSVTFGIRPTSPEGRVVLIFCRYCCPPSRPMLRPYEVPAPALFGSLVVTCERVKPGPAPQPTTETPNPSSVALPGSAYGVNLAAPVGVPHDSGLASAVSMPRLKWSERLLKGCSGGSFTTVVSWPVVSLGMTSAFSRTETPYRFEFATMYIV